jgi:hypothetical protein
MTDEIDYQEVVAAVDELLREGLQHANTYVGHNEARKRLDDIDEREFNDEVMG